LENTNADCLLRKKLQSQSNEEEALETCRDDRSMEDEEDSSCACFIILWKYSNLLYVSRLSLPCTMLVF